ncbi:hypothetical protein Btru_049245 [Bulinus truncatus]|nr:hypothetical protein Btru_049245 [Bulinus truncatus]
MCLPAGIDATQQLGIFSDEKSRGDTSSKAEVSTSAHVSGQPAPVRTLQPSIRFPEPSKVDTKSDYVILHKLIISEPFKLQSESTTLYPFIDQATAMDYLNDYESRPRPKRWPLRILLDVSQRMTDEKNSHGLLSAEEKSKIDVSESSSTALNQSLLSSVSMSKGNTANKIHVTEKSASKLEAHIPSGSTGDTTVSTSEVERTTGQGRNRSQKKKKTSSNVSRKQNERRNKKGRKFNEEKRPPLMAHHILAGADYARLTGPGPTQAGLNITQNSKRDGRKRKVGERKSKRRTESPGRDYPTTAPTGRAEVSTRNASAATALPQQTASVMPEIARLTDNGPLRNSNAVDQSGLDSDWSLKPDAPSFSNRTRSWPRDSTTIDPRTNPTETNSHEPVFRVETQPSKCASYIRYEQGSHPVPHPCSTERNSMDGSHTSQRPVSLIPVIRFNEQPPENVPTNNTVTTGDDKPVYANVYDFLSNQQVHRHNSQPRKFDAFNRDFAEKMCGIFGRRFVPTPIGGKCE